MTEAIIGVVVILIAGLLLMARSSISRSGAGRDYEVKRRRLLTPREIDAFGRLLEIANEKRLHVCPQASIDAFVRFEGEGAFRERSRYKARRSDFALMNHVGDVVLVVEVDDSSHRSTQDADAARDAVIALAGVPTLRIPAGRLPDRNDMRRRIQNALAGRSGRV